MLLNFSQIGRVVLEEDSWKNCVVCGRVFQACNSADIYCSDKCSAEAESK